MRNQLTTLATQQRGEGGLGGMVAMVIVFVMALKLGTAIVPAQLSDRNLDSTIAKALHKINAKKGDQRALISEMQGAFQINAIYDVPVEERYTINGGPGGFSITKDYSAESMLFPGVFITNKFEGEIEPSAGD